MDKPFDGSRIKLARAQHFINELKREREAYQALGIEVSLVPSNPPQVLVKWPGWPNPGAIVGDAVHNLRTSLDFMATELVRLNNGNEKDVYFPIADVEENLDSQIKRKNFVRAGGSRIAKSNQAVSGW